MAAAAADDVELGTGVGANVGVTSGTTKMKLASKRWLPCSASSFEPSVLPR